MEYSQWFLQNFHKKLTVSVQTGVTGVRKINSVLFARKLISVALPYKDLFYYKDFLGEDKK